MMTIAKRHPIAPRIESCIYCRTAVVRNQEARKTMHSIVGQRGGGAKSKLF
jgi:hypothetical protein